MEAGQKREDCLMVEGNEWDLLLGGGGGVWCVVKVQKWGVLVVVRPRGNLPRDNRLTAREVPS